MISQNPESTSWLILTSGDYFKNKVRISLQEQTARQQVGRNFAPLRKSFSLQFF